ncbi:MAG: DUF927 domain-containing protein [Terricaulis sp.]
MLTPPEIAHAFRTTPQAIEYHTTTEATVHVEARSTGMPKTQVIGDAIKPIALVLHPDGSYDVLFAFIPRSTKVFTCQAVALNDLSRGRATSCLRKRGWWSASDNADKHLNAMLGDVRDVLPTFRRAPHAGLQDDDTFLLNQTVIGANAANWRLDPAQYVATQRAGSAAGWRTWSARAADYPLILLPIATALANLPKEALLIPGFGIVVHGGTGSGKSISTGIARSVIGDPDKLENWNTSRPGLEGMLLRNSGTPYTPDELRSGSDIQRDETITHLIGNERLKTLAPGYSSGQRVQVIIFTNKELKVTDLRLRSPNQGDDARWINIRVRDGKQGVLIGANEDDDTGALMNEFLADARAHHGWAYEDFARRLLGESDWRSLCEEAFQVSMQAIVGKNLSPLEERVRRTFALIGATGFLSAELGTTTWDPRAPLDAVAECFHYWREPYDATGSSSSSNSKPAADAKVLEALRLAGARPAVVTAPQGPGDNVLKLLAAATWPSLEELRRIGAEPEQNDPDCEPFLHMKDDEELICVGTAYLTAKLRENPERTLRLMKAAKILITNATGLCLSVKARGRTQQFVAVPSRLVGLKVEVEGSFNP